MSPQRKTALVTGGARRLGAAICMALAQDGFRVAIHHNVSLQAAVELAEEIDGRFGNGSAIPLEADITSPDARAGLVDQVASAFGRLDLLVNNASIYSKSPLQDLTREELLRYHIIHVEAPVELAMLSRRLLAKGAPGGIINILDVFADFPRKGFLPYCASKAGLSAITKQLALELAPAILVNGVAPGAILHPEGGLDEATESRIVSRIPMGRFGQADDVARTVVFLARSAYITGQVITVDGGRSINI
ncbi:MAG: SDR family oxidoreductase [Nitrospinota bacterium]|nr:SDR family oxidoreductase [Nitrospinota bacterium]